MADMQGVVPYGPDAQMVPDGSGGYRLQYSDGRLAPQMRFFRRPDGSFATSQGADSGKAFSAVPRMMEMYAGKDTAPNGAPLNTYGQGPEQYWFNPYYMSLHPPGQNNPDAAGPLTPETPNPTPPAPPPTAAPGTTTPTVTAPNGGNGMGNDPPDNIPSTAGYWDAAPAGGGNPFIEARNKTTGTAEDLAKHTKKAEQLAADKYGLGAFFSPGFGIPKHAVVNPLAKAYHGSRIDDLTAMRDTALATPGARNMPVAKPEVPSYINMGDPATNAALLQFYTDQQDAAHAGTDYRGSPQRSPAPGVTSAQATAYNSAATLMPSVEQIMRQINGANATTPTATANPFTGAPTGGQNAGYRPGDVSSTRLRTPEEDYMADIMSQQEQQDDGGWVRAWDDSTGEEWWTR